MDTDRAENDIRYEPDEPCSLWSAFGIGLQGVALVLAPTVFCVSITVQASNLGIDYLTWSVFASLVINGIVTALQAAKFGRLGAGHIIITGATPNFIAVSTTALSKGPPEMLATLIIASSFVQIALSASLPLLRRIISPVVSNTVLLLIVVTVSPIVIERIDDVPTDASLFEIVISAGVTIGAILLARSWGSDVIRVWAALIGIVLGCIVSGFFDFYEFHRLHEADWWGVPKSEFAGVDLIPGIEFWALLPMFIVVTLVGAIKNVGDGIVIQRFSYRSPKATDFRRVQSGLNVNGIGTFLSGVAGTPPTTMYGSFCLSLINLSGVASRRVGYAIGIVLCVLAVFPKFVVILTMIPNPVLMSYLILTMLFLVQATV